MEDSLPYCWKFFLRQLSTQSSPINPQVPSSPDHGPSPGSYHTQWSYVWAGASTACPHQTRHLSPSLSPGLPSLMPHISLAKPPVSYSAMSSGDFGTLDPPPSPSGLGAPTHHMQEPTLCLVSPHHSDSLMLEHLGPHVSNVPVSEHPKMQMKLRLKGISKPRCWQAMVA